MAQGIPPRRRAATSRALLLLAAAALLAAGCGDDTAGGQWSGVKPPQGPTGPSKKKAAPAPKISEDERVMVPEWKLVQPYFEKFVNQPLMTHKDTFRDNLVKHVPKVDLPEPEPVEEMAEVEDFPKPATDEGAAGPLERYPSEQYELIMIMSGTVIPKALVVDPIGAAWIVQKDARFGNMNGIVQNITQYSMIVQEPDKDKPIEKTIKPPIFELASDFSAIGPTDSFRLTGPAATGN